MNLFDPLKKALPILFTDKVTIKITEKYQDEHHITQSRECVLVEDEPAKVILSRQDTSAQGMHGTDTADAILLLRNGIFVPAGAVILATDQNGLEVKYQASSKGYAGYHSHQRVAMKRDEKA